MAASNYDDVIAQLHAAGLCGRGLDDGLRIGKMARCQVEGDRERRGWYMLHELQTQRGDLLLVGSFGIWHGNDNGAQKVELRKTDLTSEQRDSLRKRLAEDRRRLNAQRKADAERAARRAAAAWSKYATDGDSDYLTRKRVRALGVRFTPGGAMVVPVSDASGVVHGLQIIRTAAQAKERGRPAKEFWPSGLAKKGHFHLIGLPTWIVLVAEGYATAASLHDATQLPVAVAFDANNLAPTAAALHKRYPAAKILICADDDALATCKQRDADGKPCGTRFILADHSEDCPGCGKPHRCANTGVDAATAAALEVNGAWIRPAFTDESKRRAAFLEKGVKPTDFNDLACAETTTAVRTQLEARITELNWRPPAPRAPASAPEGGGAAPLQPLSDLNEMLDRFALVYGSETVFDRDEHMLLTIKTLGHACCNRNVYKAWAEHPLRRLVRAREVGFDPGCEDPDVTCNLWGGWPTQPQAGRCDKLLELLRYMCSEEAKSSSADLYEWVLNWLAYPIQHPGAKLKTTLVLHGGQGVGKNLFFEAIMAIYGEYGRVINQDALEDKFNDWASRKLFLIADEVVARLDLYHVKNKLKAFITGDWIRINPKQIKAYDERNHVNMVFLSNEPMPLVLDKDDRRHAVIWTPQTLPADFYAAVRKEIADGGIPALHNFLLERNIGDFHPGTLPPQTDAKRELIGLSQDTPSGFFEALLNGDIGEFQLCHALTRDVYDLYRTWCGRQGEKRIAPLPKFSNALQRKHRVRQERKRYAFGAETYGPHGMLMLGMDQPSPGEVEAEFYGDAIIRFRGWLRRYKEAEHG